MLTTNHLIATTRSRQGRAIGISLAILLNVAFVSALVIGLRSTIFHTPEGQVTIIPTKPVDEPQPPIGTFHPIDPNTPTAITPVVNIADGYLSKGAIFTKPGDEGGSYAGDVVFSPPGGIMATHTTPPYPPLALRLGEAGTVRLHITISPEGRVTGVSVVRSSGFAELDSAASEWVKAHWRYRPATRGGAAVESSAEAEVLFDLKNAR
jgi:protein TonB